VRDACRHLGAFRQPPGNFRKRGTAWWRTHSHSNLSPHPNSRLSGKITGNFVNRMLYRLFAGVKQPTFRGSWPKFPVKSNREFFCREPGHFRQANGKLSQRQLEGGAIRRMCLLYTRHKRWSWRLNPEPRARPSRLPDLEGFAVPLQSVHRARPTRRCENTPGHPFACWLAPMAVCWMVASRW
jgi:hypothetical protein